jgi:4-amino-4-deoxy-L-arabinose transferase-like glycosyltransferase
MTISKPLDRALPYLLLAVFFAVSIAARPLLPVDETRYLTVSWEMFLRQSFFVPTMNFEPYFQKPPLLFWLIDLAWSLFGVSRLSAVGVIFVISSLVIYLTQRLAKALFRNTQGIAERTPWLMLGSTIFVIYSSLILFDLLLTLFVLAFMLALLAFSRGRGLRYAVLAGLFIGLGVLSKGPVVLIHVASPILMYPLWRNSSSDLPTRKFFSGIALALLVAFFPVIAWLGPAFYQTGTDFAYNLVWRQAAGRVSGSMEGAHARPIYFYLLLLPVALLPWILSVDLWRSKPWQHTAEPQDRRILRFLALWCLVVLIVFSLISGKQPHYLVPILPPLILLFGYFMSTVRLATIRTGALVMLALVGVGQAIAAFTVFDRYDLKPLAAYVAEHRSAEWAFAGRYQGELTFLARMEKPFEILAQGSADDWLGRHPTGYVIVETGTKLDSNPQILFTQPIEKGYLTVLGNPK